MSGLRNDDRSCLRAGRDVCERAAADAGIKADLDEVLAEQFEDPDAGMGCYTTTPAGTCLSSIRP